MGSEASVQYILTTQMVNVYVGVSSAGLSNRDTRIESIPLGENNAYAYHPIRRVPLGPSG